MRNKLKSRKGATLAELVIVLAVVVIAAGMVVSFSSMMHGAQGISNARHEALQDVRVAEALIESFIENNADKELFVSDGGGKLSYKMIEGGEEKEYSVFFTNAKAFVVAGNDVMFLESLDSIAFVKETGTNDTLYYCTITYSVADAPHSYTYTFCVNPYAGEGGT